MLSFHLEASAERLKLIKQDLEEDQKNVEDIFNLIELKRRDFNDEYYDYGTIVILYCIAFF